jgi:cell wall-associated NlpC family hydrolase
MRLIAAVIAAALIMPSSAFAAPVTNSKIEAAKKEAAAAESRLLDLQADLEERAEEYAEVVAALEKTSADLTQTRPDLEREAARLERSKVRLSERAVTMYRNGPLQPLTVFFGVRDFEDFSTRMDLMARIGRSDAETVAEVKDAKAAVEKAEASLESRRAEQVVLREREGAKKAEVQQAMEAQADYLAGLRKEVSKLIAQERERQRKLAEARAKAAAEAARRASASAKPARRSGPLGAPHPEVVDVAMKYLGVPYVWGGTTPNGFDCSGLCQYSYNKIGISIPRTSREQFKVGAFIPENRRDLLEPGDLVFFGRNGDPDRVHHVGIYVGSGDFIEAPYTGANVKISSLDDRIASRGDYVGATRP